MTRPCCAAWMLRDHIRPAKPELYARFLQDAGDHGPGPDDTALNQKAPLAHDAKGRAKTGKVMTLETALLADDRVTARVGGYVHPPCSMDKKPA